MIVENRATVKPKKALVTGASRGIGKAVALQLARDGLELAICSRDQDRIDAAADEIGDLTSIRPLSVVADLCKKKQIDSLVKRVKEKFGSVDVLICNTGNPAPGSPLDIELSEEAWHETHSLVVMSAVTLCRSLVPAMKSNGIGRIVIINSIYGLTPSSKYVLSSTYRAALLSFTKSLARCVASDGITVNSICLGYIDTELLRELADDRAINEHCEASQILERWAKKIPAKRLGTPQDVADLISFLASERASFITGTSLCIDGGLLVAL